MAQYTRGRIAATKDSLVITGTDTLWFNNVSHGDVFKPKNVSIYGTVAAVVSNTEITLNSPWLGETLSNSEYQLTRDFTAAFDFYEIYPGDVNWPYYITQNFRKIDNLFDIMSDGVISAYILAARDEAVSAVGSVDVSVSAAAASASAAAASASAAATSASTASEAAETAGASALSAEDDAASALTSKTAAAASAFQAETTLAITNYKGRWSALTGSLAVPASVTHDSLFWSLVQNVTDVSANVPGTSAVWKPLDLALFNRAIGYSGRLVFYSVQAVIEDETLILGDYVQTLDYYGDSPGGGAFYTIVDAGTGANDGFLHIDMANGLQMELNMIDGYYHAKQAGVMTQAGTDDSAKVAAALLCSPSGSVFVFDPGFIYNISSVAITLFGNHTIIAHGAMFQCTTDALAFELNSSKLQNILCIKWYGGIFVNTAGTLLASQAIHAEKCIDINIEDAVFNRFFNPINCINSKSVSVGKNYFVGNKKDVVLSGCRSTKISKNAFTDISSTGVDLIDCDNTSIGSNDFAQTIAGAGIPIKIDANCTKTDIGQNAYADAKIQYSCPRSEITCWPYRITQADVVPVTGYNGTSFSTGSATIDMSSFSPSYIIPRGYELTIQARDSASSTSLDTVVEVCRNVDTPAQNRISLRLGGYGLADDLTMCQSGYVAADDNGDIFVNQIASGVDTTDIWIGVSSIIL